LRGARGDVSEDTVKLYNTVEILAKDSHFDTAMGRARGWYKAVDLRERK
jgi:hypothetical protein